MTSVKSFSNSASVLWADGKSTAPNGVSRYQLNEAPAIDIPYLATPVNTTKISTSSFTNDVDALNTFTETEAAGDITTTKTLFTTDILTANVTIGGTLYTFMQSVGEETLPSGEVLGGKYYTGTMGTLNRIRDME